MPKLAILFLTVIILSSCGPKPADVAHARQQQQRQLSEAEFHTCARAIPRGARDGLIQFSECMTRAENMNNPPDPLKLRFAASIREIGIQLRDGSINRETAKLRADLIHAEYQLAWERRENERRIVNAQQAQARAVNCANIRYRNQNSSNSAINSTIPAVAILGLFAEIGAMSEEAEACD